MKRVLAGFAVMAVMAVTVQASGYPPEFYASRTYAQRNGPAVFAKSAKMGQQTFAIGYRKDGMLGASQKVVAIVTSCYMEEYAHSAWREKCSGPVTVELGREWNGTGFMSTPLNSGSLTGYNGQSVNITRVEIAFSDGVRWDSVYGRNYKFSIEEMQRGPVFTSSQNSSYNSHISTDAWNYILDLMRK